MLQVISLLNTGVQSYCSFAVLQNTTEAGEKRVAPVCATFCSTVTKWQEAWLWIMVWERILLILTGKAWASWPYWVLCQDIERGQEVGPRLEKLKAAVVVHFVQQGSIAKLYNLVKQCPQLGTQSWSPWASLWKACSLEPRRKPMGAAHGTLGQGMVCS